MWLAMDGAEWAVDIWKCVIFSFKTSIKRRIRLCAYRLIHSYAPKGCKKINFQHSFDYFQSEVWSLLILPFMFFE